MNYLISIQERGDTAPRSLPMGDELTIGRIAGNHLVIADRDVSKRHARLERRGGDCVVIDAGSTNGTFVNGERIRGPHPVGEGDSIGIGSARLSIERVVEWSAASRGRLRPPASSPRPSATVAADGSSAGASSGGAPSVGLRKTIHDRLIEALDLRRLDLDRIDADALRIKSEAAVRGIIVELEGEGAIGPAIDRERLLVDVIDEVLGLGPLEELLADDDVSEIMVNHADQIFVERHGKIVASDKTFSSNRAVLSVIERIVAPIGRRIDSSSPLVDARLQDGSRVHAIIPPLALKGPCITIRKFKREKLSDRDLVRFGSLTDPMAAFLALAVRAKKNIVISGGTGSGKTTLLNVMTSFIPSDERIVTVEDAAELQIRQPHWVQLESRPPNIEGRGAITIRDLVNSWNIS